MERALARGEVAPGTVLPTIRAVADRLGVSPATVASGYRELARRGVVHGDGRRGTRIAHRPPISDTSHRVPVARVDAGGGLRRDLSIGNPDPALLPDPASALAAAASAGSLYGSSPIDERLVAWAEHDLASAGIATDAVTVVSGALDGVERVLQAWVRPGDAVAVEDPGFPPLFDLLAALTLRAVPVELDATGMIPDSLARALAGGATTVVLTPRAQNPTGAALDAARTADLRQVLEAHPNALLIEDDHAGLVAGAEVHSVAPGRERWAVVRSVAKSLGPDLRVAPLAGDTLTVARVEGRQRLGPGWVSRYLQRATLLLARDRAVQAGLRAATRTYRERRDALLEALGDRGVEARGSSGMNIWVPVPEEATVVGRVAAKGWTISPGTRFRLRTPPAVRVTTSALPVDQAPVVADILADAIAATRARSASRLG